LSRCSHLHALSDARPRRHSYFEPGAKGIIELNGRQRRKMVAARARTFIRRTKPG
jgi:hypothetical protein